MKKLMWTGLALALPLTSFAALGNIDGLITDIGNIINKIIPIMFALALLGFFYGLVKYIFGKEDDKDAAKKTMIWGVVALFVMASVWGLVRFIGTAVGIDEEAAPSVSPLIPN
ncbi:MAG: hypothetical protein WC657_03335 [Candidatus Paceibacterota bacterium]|jgi:hypothetical protein